VTETPAFSHAAVGEENNELPRPSFQFPLRWLLEHGSPVIQHRASREVAGLETGQAPVPPASRTALELAVSQSPDGVWNGAMLSVPQHPQKSTTGVVGVVGVAGVAGVGTIPAALRLVESGWGDPESPPMVHARRILFRMLAEDNDPAYLFELRGAAKDDDSIKASRRLLREAAAAALARAGYESDPRLRGAARRILQRLYTFLTSDLAAKPWMRVGNVHVLSPEATPPSIYALQMFAHMPTFRHEQHIEMRLLYEYISQPMPRQECVQLVGKEIVPKPHLVLGDMLSNRNVVDADVPFALFWLELMARLGFLEENEHWLKMFQRMDEDRNRAKVWHPHKGSAHPSSDNPYAWHMFPLQEDMDGEGAWADVTFRLGLIAKIMDWEIKLV
jgi:hypothetical protein